eukprot:4152806-Amphidinium_carterae.1
MFTKGTVADLLKKGEREQRRRRRREANAEAFSPSAPAATNQDGKEDARGKVLSSPGVNGQSSESEDEAGAQDEQDRAAEGPLGARKIVKYAPYHRVTNSDVHTGGVMRRTGSDVRWSSRVGLRPGDASNAYEKTPDPRRGHYVCPGCNAKFHLSEMLADHMITLHGIGIEPNFCNEYSVGELVSGINNLAVGKKFRADDGETKPKFIMKKPEVRIPWMGHPIFEMDNEP